MNLLSNVFNSTSYWTKGSSALCGIVMGEMGIRTIIDITQNKKEDLSADLSGALFYGMCASNIVPGFARLGSLVFIIYSYSYGMFTDTSERNEYWSSKAVHFLAEKIYEVLVFTKIGECINFIFEKWVECYSFIYEKTYNGLNFIKNYLNIEDHPTWVGVAFLISCIGVYIIRQGIFKTKTFLENYLIRTPNKALLDTNGASQDLSAI